LDASKAKFFSQDIFDRFYAFFKPAVVSATGGEPLLEKDSVLKIARSTNNYGGAMEVVTNGFFLTSDMVQKLAEINSNTFYQISLDGLSAFHNDLRRNPNAFDAALKAIDTASGFGAKTKVRLTATNENFNEIPALIDVLDGFGRENICLVMRPVLPAGRAQANGLSVNVPFSEFNKFADNAKFIEVETTDNMGKCGCGSSTIAVDPYGGIYPCTYFVSDEKYCMGNIEGDLNSMNELKEFVEFKGVCYARHLNK
jgi:uncharacterized protein